MGRTVRGSNPGGDRIFFSLLQNSQTGSGAHPVFYSIGAGFISQR